MVRRGRYSSKEDLSILTDSAISLSSSGDSINKHSEEEEIKENLYRETIQITDDEHSIVNRSNLRKRGKLNKNQTNVAESQKAKKQHKCEVCFKHFRGNTDLKRHALIHSGERPHKCELCGKSFRQAVNLKNHKTIVHDGHKEFACSLCPKTFALKERLRLHMRIHSGEKPYKCEHCHKRFARGGQLTQHLITNHENSSKKHKCEKCSAKFLTAGNLRAHLKRHEEGIDTYCSICNEHFPNAVILRTHISNVHEKSKVLNCEVCKELIRCEEFASHMKNHSKHKLHICSFCNACFSQKSQYNVHVRMHTGERPYQCRVCLQSFAHSSVLKLHIRKHTGEKPFNCVLCKDVVAFSQLAHLKTHMKKVHNQQNPYLCEGCNEFFKVKADLQLHLEKSKNCIPPNKDNQNLLTTEKQNLSHIRFLIAILLKKISSEKKLKQLGYEKRLIDNVVIASLKLASRNANDDKNLSPIERLRLNVEEFLNWIVPDKIMQQFRNENLSVDTMLDKIVSMHLKQH